MSKRKTPKRNERNQTGSSRGYRRKALAVIALILCLSLAAVGILAQWRGARVTEKMHAMLRPMPAPPVAGFTSDKPSKEYVYGGGKLIATEEPGLSTLISAPSGLKSTTVSSSAISLTWVASTGPVDHYQVERSQSISGPYTPLSLQPTTNSIPDSSVVPETAYLYRVRGVDTAGNFTTTSNIYLSTAVDFTNDPLARGTGIYADHVLQLRRAVDAVRQLAGLPAAGWSVPAPQVGGAIRATQVQELRDNLNPALSALGLATLPNDTTIGIGQPIKATHLQDVRNIVR